MSCSADGALAMNLPIYIAVPVYNGEATIRKTLRNLLQQTYRDFRILVYDDGSTDRTAQCVTDMAAGEERITLISGSKNLGRGAARNRLLQECHDGLMAWQDADDTWNPTKLEKQLQFYGELSNSDKDPATSVIISTFKRSTTRPDGTHSSKLTPPPVYDAAFLLGEDYRLCPFQLQATFGPAAVYQAAGAFDEQLNWSEDLDIALKMLSHGLNIIPHISEKALATYHHSLSSARGEEVERSQTVVKNRHRAFARGLGVDIDAVFEGRRLNYLFNIYLDNNNYTKALALTMAPLSTVDQATLARVARNILKVMDRIVTDKIHSVSGSSISSAR